MLEFDFAPLLKVLAVILTTLVLQETTDHLGPIGNVVVMVFDESAKLTELKSPYRKIDAFPPPNDDETYDFIIVGASPSGAVLANRLTEIGKWNVILLEAGGLPSVLTEIPGTCQILGFTAYDWGDYAEVQEEHCRGCIDHRLRYFHGKGLGGSTIINFMVYVRGNKLDYDKWEAMGNPGWSYDDVLPYFKKSEDALIAVKEDEYHGQSGYLKISDSNYRTESAKVWVKSSIEAGHKYVDYNGRSQNGVSFVQSFTRDGKRIHGENSFLRPIRKRNNLRVRTGAHVTKVLINPETNTAYGVEYVKDNKTFKVFSRKEVILAAGCLRSPQILMLSGIGPKDHLVELGISVIIDLPVGKKMYDHSTFTGLVYHLEEEITFQTPRDTLDPNTYIDYLFDGTGPLSLIGGVEAVTYVKTNVTDPEYPNWPDIELIFASTSPAIDFGLFLRILFNIPRKMFDVLYKQCTGKPCILVYPQLMHPRSVGYIRLRSKNPFEAPRYFTNFFSDPENKDVKAHLAAVREVQRIVSQPTFQRYGAKIIDTPNPACSNFAFDSDQYWECVIRAQTGSLWHQQATCKMGPKEDIEAVVDARLRVHGIKNLRVIDTSVIPRSISAHMAAPSYMLGEKGADIIKQDWREISLTTSELHPQSESEQRSEPKNGNKSNSDPEAGPATKSEQQVAQQPSSKVEAGKEQLSETKIEGHDKPSEPKNGNKSNFDPEARPAIKSEQQVVQQPTSKVEAGKEQLSETKIEGHDKPRPEVEPGKEQNTRKNIPFLGFEQNSQFELVEQVSLENGPKNEQISEQNSQIQMEPKSS